MVNKLVVCVVVKWISNISSSLSAVLYLKVRVAWRVAVRLSKCSLEEFIHSSGAVNAMFSLIGRAPTHRFHSCITIYGLSLTHSTRWHLQHTTHHTITQSHTTNYTLTTHSHPTRTHTAAVTTPDHQTQPSHFPGSCRAAGRKEYTPER